MAGGVTCVTIQWLPLPSCSSSLSSLLSLLSSSSRIVVRFCTSAATSSIQSFIDPAERTSCFGGFSAWLSLATAPRVRLAGRIAEYGSAPS